MRVDGFIRAVVLMLPISVKCFAFRVEHKMFMVVVMLTWALLSLAAPTGQFPSIPPRVHVTQIRISM
jgi:hypothetical protein